MNDSIRAGLDSLAQQVAEGVAEVKPRLRGWLHLATAPLTLLAGIVLVRLCPTATTRPAPPPSWPASCSWRPPRRPPPDSARPCTPSRRSCCSACPPPTSAVGGRRG